MKPPLQKIYPISDNQLSGLSLGEQIKQFIDGGATLIQIRDKKAMTDQLFRDVTAAIEIARASNVAILINDRVDIALVTRASGVHLGQDDIPVSEARRILGNDAIIGLSTHNEEQVNRALNEGDSDYIAFGPIFASNTKSDHQPVVGLKALERVRKLIGGDRPLVAIGGIKAENLASVINAGADSAAMISEFYKVGLDITDQYRSLLKVAENKNTVVTS